MSQAPILPFSGIPPHVINPIGARMRIYNIIKTTFDYIVATEDKDEQSHKQHPLIEDFITSEIQNNEVSFVVFTTDHADESNHDPEDLSKLHSTISNQSYLSISHPRYC